MGQRVDIINPFSGRAVHPGESAVRQWPWEQIADLTVAKAALAAEELNSTYINALGTTKAGIYSPVDGQVAFELRARGDGTGTADTCVIELYAAAKDILSGLFFYRRVATLSFNQGTGEWWPTAVDPAPATIFFCDEITPSNNSWLSTVVDCGVDASEDYATYVLNVHGYAKFAVIMSTKDAQTTHLYIDVRRF